MKRTYGKFGHECMNFTPLRSKFHAPTMSKSVASFAEPAHGHEVERSCTSLSITKQSASAVLICGESAFHSISSQTNCVHCEDMDSSETPTTSPTDSTDCMELDEVSVAPVSKEIFEPIRRLDCFAPPKRFYRTFWRSMAGRILKSSSTHMIVDNQ